jgi:prepilin-type N-terminal cleavage/methylation domain-containing protein
MTYKSRGFTFMELLAVIIILGILSAIALPKLFELTNETLDGSVQAVAGSLGSASAINYAAFVANSAKVGVQRLNAANVCTDAILGPLLVGGGASGTSNQTGNGNGNGNNGNANGNGNGNGNGNNGNGNGNGNSDGNNGNGNGNGNNGNGNGNNGNGNGNGNANGKGNGGSNNANGNGASVSQLMPNTNGVTYAVLTPPTGNCSGANAGGTMVSCVLTATNGTVTRSATATVICTG